MEKKKTRRKFNKPSFIQAARDEWYKYTTKPNSILVMRYLQSEAGSRLNALKYRLKRGEIDEIQDEWWRVINPTNKDISESLSQHGLVAWKSANELITRALTDLEESGLIVVHKKNRRVRIIGVGADLSHNLVTKCDSNVTKMCLKCDSNVSKMCLNEVDSSPENKDISGIGVVPYNNIEYNDTPKTPSAIGKSLKNPQLGSQLDEDTKSEDTKKKVPLLANTDETMVKSIDMKREGEPTYFTDEMVAGLEEYIQELSDQWLFKGGLDNDEIKLSQWLQSPVFKQLVTPWLREDITYDDIRDFPAIQLETTKKFGWVPSTFGNVNRIGISRSEEGKETGRQFYATYAQPFDNPYLSPDKKGLAFIRLYPFGYSTRDFFGHPWSPPLIPWAVVADDKEMLDKWKKEYWKQGSHPFEHDKTTQRIKEAIVYGNTELRDDPFFDQERYSSINEPPNIAGARTSIIVNPGPFQLLHWYCGTIGVSPTVMIDAFKRWETYNGGFPGLNLRHPSNQNADKIRIFANYLMHATWGNKGNPSFLPREQGVQKSLQSGLGQEWEHNGVLGGTSVLVRCHDGEAREVWLNQYQKAVYDLKFNPKSDQDSEILDSLLSELL